MLSKIYRILFSFLALFPLWGCTDSLDGPEPELVPDSPGIITLRFYNTAMTRSEESDNSEKLIDNALVALYPLNADEDVPAVLTRTFPSATIYTTRTVTMQLTESIVKQLFNEATGNKCNAYVLVNAPDAYAALGNNPTIAQIKNVSVGRFSTASAFSPHL